MGHLIPGDRLVLASVYRPRRGRIIIQSTPFAPPLFYGATETYGANTVPYNVRILRDALKVYGAMQTSGASKVPYNAPYPR